MAGNNTPNLLNYPASLGKDVAQGQHYLLIDSYESSSAVDKEGQGTRKSSIALYIPPQAMQTTITQNYSPVEGGARLAAMGGSTAASATSALLSGITSKLTKPQIVNDFRAAGHGLARNAHMALVYRGPSAFREHPFTFDFWPKDETEAETVKKIINDFKQGSTPRMAGHFSSETRHADKLTAPYFHAPRQWEIKYCKGKQAKSGKENNGENKYLFTIGRSVITSVVISHDPDGVVGFHKDGSPVHSKLTVTFQETTYVTSMDEVSKEDQAEATAAQNQDRQQAIKAHIATGGTNTTASGGWTPSDYRLKDNITLLQERAGVPNIYSFNYKWDKETTWIGVMAQELLDTGYSDAVGMNSDGFYWVDYSRLGFPMIGIK